MVSSLLARLFAPLSSDERGIRHHILWWMLVRVLLYTLLLSIAAYLRDKGQESILPPLPQASLFLLAIYGFSIASALLLPKTTWPARRFGVVQLLCDTAINACLVYCKPARGLKPIRTRFGTAFNG